MAVTIARLQQASEFEATLFRLLAEEGLTDDALKVLVNNVEARGKAVQFMNHLTEAFGATPAYQRARDILAHDFVTPQEISEACDIEYYPSQLAWLSSTIPSKEVLQWAYHNGYAVVAGPPQEMSLLDIYNLNTDLFYSGVDTYQRLACKDQVVNKWLIISKRHAYNSTGKTWSEQLDLLQLIKQAFPSDDLRVPNAAEVAWFLTVYAKARGGIRLMPNVYVRTSSAQLYGHHVDVGFFSDRGLRVFPHSGEGRSSDIGVAVARK